MTENVGRLVVQFRETCWIVLFHFQDVSLREQTMTACGSNLYHDIPLFSDTLSNPLDLKGIDLQEDCRPSVFVGSVELGSDLGLAGPSFWLFRV